MLSVNTYFKMSMRGKGLLGKDTVRSEGLPENNKPWFRGLDQNLRGWKLTRNTRGVYSGINLAALNTNTLPQNGTFSYQCFFARAELKHVSLVIRGVMFG